MSFTGHRSIFLFRLIQIKWGFFFFFRPTRNQWVVISPKCFKTICWWEYKHWNDMWSTGFVNEVQNQPTPSMMWQKIMFIWMKWSIRFAMCYHRRWVGNQIQLIPYTTSAWYASFSWYWFKLMVMILTVLSAFMFTVIYKDIIDNCTETLNQKVNISPHPAMRLGEIITFYRN